MKKEKYVSLIPSIYNAIESTRSVSGFLRKLPELFSTHLMLENPVVYYRDERGNKFTPYCKEEAISSLTAISGESSIVNFFSTRREAFRIDRNEQVYFDIFNRESGLLLQSMNVNVVFPLRSRQFFRGLLLGHLTRKQLKHLDSISEYVSMAAQLFVPSIETDRLELENDRNYYRLFKFDRLVLLGQMAASLAHELKTPMSTVLLEIQELRDLQLNPDEMNHSFKKIRDQLIRLNEFIESLLSFSKFKPVQIEKVILSELIQTALTGIPKKRYPRNLKISTQLHPDLSVKTDRNRLQQVLYNIIFNAFDACGPEGRLEIRTYSEKDHLKKRCNHVISISDNGRGIPQELKKRVLEPFFTTKENGTGLGLYISYGIMKSLKGDLEIQSSPRGTTVFIILQGEKN